MDDQNRNIAPPASTVQIVTTFPDGRQTIETKSYYSEIEFKIYSMTIKLLGAIVIITVLGFLIISLLDKAIPEAVIGIGSAAIGVLAGVMAPSPQQPKQPTIQPTTQPTTPPTTQPTTQPTTPPE